VKIIQDDLNFVIDELSQDPNELVRIKWFSASSPHVIYQSNACHIGKIGAEEAALIVEYYGAMWSLNKATEEPHKNHQTYTNIHNQSIAAREIGKKLLVALYKIKEA
jgi:hypothetical protein